ncbi:hypothetical protein [Sorangium sp. So ce542]|uniref:hypothetical protein n=1 Tax=Sorangium sp. So ce542 TaxID=3133316 RepID=UPI003F5E709E
MHNHLNPCHFIVEGAYHRSRDSRNYRQGQPGLLSVSGSLSVEFVQQVLSGQLVEQYPDHVKAIRSADDYRTRLAHVLDVLGPFWTSTGGP